MCNSESNDTSNSMILVPSHRPQHRNRLSHSRRSRRLALAANNGLRTDLLVLFLLVVIRNRELKHGPVIDPGRNPHPAIMRLDDRAADGQPHPDSARLCREESVEYPVDVLQVAAV